MPGMPNIPAINAFKNVKFNVIPKIPPIKLKTISSNIPEMLLIISFPTAFIEKLKSPKNSIIRIIAIMITRNCIISPINFHFRHWNCRQDFDHYHYYSYYLRHCHYLNFDLYLDLFHLVDCHFRYLYLSYFHYLF